MKWSALFLFTLPIALALPSGGASGLVGRQTATALTDTILFSITLPAFEVRRNALNPPTLDWSSDGCTSSPDNPIGFPFVPACHRHDFGYQNYRAQARFTVSSKLSIDNNFKTDLYYQCGTVNSLLRGVCKALADVYYAAVRNFGGGDASPGKRLGNDELLHEYEEKLAIYNALVKEAQEKGLLPSLE